LFSSKWDAIRAFQRRDRHGLKALFDASGRQGKHPPKDAAMANEHNWGNWLVPETREMLQLTSEREKARGRDKDLER